MTNKELSERLTRLADSEKLTEEEADAVFLALRILERKNSTKSVLLDTLRLALHKTGEL